MITAENGSLVVSTPYNPGFIAQFKSVIPQTDRTWNSARKVWFVAPQYGQLLADLIRAHYGMSISIPDVKLPERSAAVFELHYIGACKQREGEDEPTAWACQHNGAWDVIFPQSVLQAWFLGFDSNAPVKHTTLYGVLGVKRTDDEQAIKSAYRRLARQWHPDVCKEPDAAERFMEIQRAYDVLKEPGTKQKYDAGLALEATLPNNAKIQTRTFSEYRAPLRCGLVMVEGIETLGRYRVDTILVWQDIIRNGKTLVVSWPAGADHWVEMWV